jgi:hypothetical protein
MKNTLLHKPITTIEEAKQYIDFLNENNILYHLDEDSRNIVDFETGKAFEDIFFDEDLDAMDARNDEMSGLDWDKHEYCCEILGID